MKTPLHSRISPSRRLGAEKETDICKYDSSFFLRRRRRCYLAKDGKRLTQRVSESGQALARCAFDEGCGPSDEPRETATMDKSAEATRLEEARVQGLPWRNGDPT